MYEKSSKAGSLKAPVAPGTGVHLADCDAQGSRLGVAEFSTLRSVDANQTIDSRACWKLPLGKKPVMSP